MRWSRSTIQKWRANFIAKCEHGHIRLSLDPIIHYPFINLQYIYIFLQKKKEKRITIQPILEMIFLDVIPWQTFQEGKIIFLQEVPLHIFAFLELHNSLIKVVIARPTLLGNAFPWSISGVLDIDVVGTNGFAVVKVTSNAMVIVIMKIDNKRMMNDSEERKRMRLKIIYFLMPNSNYRTSIFVAKVFSWFKDNIWRKLPWNLLQLTICPIDSSFLDNLT